MKRTIATLTIATAALGLAACSGSPEAKHKTDVSISKLTCEDSVKSMLRDPDSAKFDTWVVHEDSIPTDATAWKVAGTVSAKNAFGGYADEKYWECEVTRTGDRDVSARAQFVDAEAIVRDKLGG